MKFKDFINLFSKPTPFGYLFESFDSTYDIIKVEHKQNISFYYVNINKEEYRIFIEKVDSDVSVGFEYLENGTPVILGKLNILTGKECLTLFGTVINILKDLNNIENIMIETKEAEKFQVYYNVAVKMAKEYNFEKVSRNNDAIFISRNLKNKDFKHKFTFKGKRG